LQGSVAVVLRVERGDDLVLLLDEVVGVLSEDLERVMWIVLVVCRMVYVLMRMTYMLMRCVVMLYVIDVVQGAFSVVLVCLIVRYAFCVSFKGPRT